MKLLLYITITILFFSSCSSKNEDENLSQWNSEVVEGVELNTTINWVVSDDSTTTTWENESTLDISN